MTAAAAAGGADGGSRSRRTNCPTVRKRTAPMLIRRSTRSRPNWTLPLLPTAAVVVVVAVSAAAAVGPRLPSTTTHYCWRIHHPSKKGPADRNGGNGIQSNEKGEIEIEKKRTSLDNAFFF